MAAETRAVCDISGGFTGQVALTAPEAATIEAGWQAWDDGAAQRQADDIAKIKAKFLAAVAEGDEKLIVDLAQHLVYRDKHNALIDLLDSLGLPALSGIAAMKISNNDVLTKIEDLITGS